MAVTVACVSDTHGKRPWIPDADILIHAGDLANSGSFSEVASAVHWLKGLPHKHKVVIAGNHDWLFQREPWAVPLLMEGLTYLQNSCAVIEGLKIYGSPYTPYFQGWAFNVDRDRLTEEMYGVPDGVDILVTHGPPLGVMDCGVGCEPLLRVVERISPRLHVFGHIHPGYGAISNGSTLFVNAAHTRDDAQPPNPVPVLEL